jgi:hypothetical protein
LGLVAGLGLVRRLRLVLLTGLLGFPGRFGGYRAVLRRRVARDLAGIDLHRPAHRVLVAVGAGLVFEVRPALGVPPRRRFVGLFVLTHLRVALLELLDLLFLFLTERIAVGFFGLGARGGGRCVGATFSVTIRAVRIRR